MRDLNLFKSARYGVELLPVWVSRFNRVDFPSSSPPLHSFFRCDSIIDVIEIFKPNETVNIMLRGK